MTQDGIRIPSTRAAWLKFIKDHGQEAGGVANFAKLLGTYPIKIKEQIDPVIVAGYAVMTGKPGPGGGFKYSLTTLGHRYLNENQHELSDQLDDDAGHAPDAEESAADTQSATPKSPEPPQPKPATNRPSSKLNLDPTLKDALFDELFERFGDQVSLKQLLKRMESAS